MKTILFVVMLTLPPSLEMDHHPLIYSVDYGTEEACQEGALRWKMRWWRDGQQETYGRIGNLPGYRAVEAAWCEDPDEPWPGSGPVPLLDGSISVQGPYTPRSQAERDRWTPVTRRR